MPIPRARILVEECRHLDVNLLNREGALIVGAIVEIRWADGYEVKLLITGPRENPSRAESLTINGSTTVELAWTGCHFGNQRPWFLCPGCNRRCAKLISYRDNGFRCRRCYGAGYRSENLTPEWRLRHRIDRLEGRLADDFERPKGMHQTTYQQICDEIMDKEEMADALFFDQVYRRFPDLLVS